MPLSFDAPNQIIKSLHRFGAGKLDI
jgi:hypothetical protein